MLERIHKAALDENYQNVAIAAAATMRCGGFLKHLICRPENVRVFASVCVCVNVGTMHVANNVSVFIPRVATYARARAFCQSSAVLLLRQTAGNRKEI